MYLRLFFIILFFPASVKKKTENAAALRCRMGANYFLRKDLQSVH